jgi:hypothetical protein
MIWMDVAAETGINKSTLSRMSQGSLPDARGLVVLFQWSGLAVSDFMRGKAGRKRNEPEPFARIFTLHAAASRRQPFTGERVRDSRNYHGRI